MLVPTNSKKCDTLLYQPLVPPDNNIQWTRHYRHTSSVLHHHHPIAPYRSTSLIQRNYTNSRKTSNNLADNKDNGDDDNMRAEATLGDKLLGDVIIGGGVTFCIAPFLTVVDKAIVQQAAGTHSMYQSGMETIASMVRHPIQYFKSPTFLWMWFVYGSTYCTANCLKTITEHQSLRQQKVQKEASTNHSIQQSKNHPPSTRNANLTVFVGTSLVNTTGALLKESAYAQMFGGANATSASKPIPKISYGLWMTRDFLVIGSSFVLPDMVSHQLHSNYGMDLTSANRIAQIFLPIVTQFLAGPLQLLGLDCYNRPLDHLQSGKNGGIRPIVVERCRFLAQGFVPVVSARIIRIAPGYSLGGVFNTKFREEWRVLVQRKQENPFLQNPSWNTIAAFRHALISKLLHQ